MPLFNYNYDFTSDNIKLSELIGTNIIGTNVVVNFKEVLPRLYYFDIWRNVSA